VAAGRSEPGRAFFAACGLAAVALLLVIGVIAAWLIWAERPVDTLARVRALPVYPGASSAKVEQKPVNLTVSGVAIEAQQGGVLTFETWAEPEDVFAYYDSKLKSAGWQPAGRQSDGGGGQYMKREGSFEGIDLAGTRDSGFPWLRMKRNQALLWLRVDISTAYVNGNKRSAVSVGLAQP
jgi:hypothetical protein